VSLAYCEKNVIKLHGNITIKTAYQIDMFCISLGKIKLVGKIRKSIIAVIIMVKAYIK